MIVGVKRASHQILTNCGACRQRIRWRSPGPVPSLDNGLSIVALVGRPNVGKSALFNRLIHRKDAMVKNTPESHVTRDYKCGIAQLGELQFTVVDTSGLEPVSQSETIQARATRITEALMKRVDLTLFMIDGRERLTVEDEDVAAWIRNFVTDESKLLLLANKCESLATGENRVAEKIRDNLTDATRLGMGLPIGISAETGDGMIDLCEALIPLVDTHESVEEPPQDDDLTAESVSDEEEQPSDVVASEGEGQVSEGVEKQTIKVAIMGLPNVGKSTLMNHLLHYERSLCGPEIGLTRDPVMDVFAFNGRRIELVDTAGWMKFFQYEKFTEVNRSLAKEAYYAAKKILNFSHVALVMLDVDHIKQQGSLFLRQELQLASTVLNEKRVLILAINKMDTLDKKEQQLIEKDITKKISDRFYDVDNLVCIPISAKTGFGVDRLLPEIVDKADKWNRKIKTSALNDWFSEVASVQRLARFSGSALRRIRFLSQTRTRPPTFCLRASGREPFTDVEKRTFVNALRQGFDFQGVPLRVKVKYNTTWDESKKAMISRQAQNRTS